MLTMTVSYFNPRSREGSDGEVSLAIAISGISIHAPAKGATRTVPVPCSYHKNFNPRSREGSDTHVRSNCSLTLNFNPRSREGSDKNIPCHQTHYLISIHAPAKGATLTFIISAHLSSDFNPRSREGSDAEGTLEDGAVGISIHAPAKGATQFGIRVACGCDISIHAPAKGATRECWRLQGYTDISIHAPAKGATCTGTSPGLSVLYFNPRSREGSDGFYWFVYIHSGNFNPRSREGSDVNGKPSV